MGIFGHHSAAGGPHLLRFAVSMSWGAAAWGLQITTELVSGTNAWAELFNRISSLISSHSQRIDICEKLDNNEDQQLKQDNLRQLQTDLQQLQTTLPKMHDLIERLEWQIHKKPAAELLPHIKDAVYDAEDLLDEFNYYELKVKVEGRANEWQCLPALQEFINSVIHGNFNRLKESQHKLDHLYYQSRDLGLQNSPLKFDKIIRPETSSFLSESKIFGRQEEVNKILELLGMPSQSNASYKRKRVDRVEVLPIVGLGGVGKTTLAQQICNDRRVNGFFDMILWSCVSDEFDVLDSKRFLLVLDDIWDGVLENNGQEWQRFCAPLSNTLPESVILVTTRSQRVADKVRTVDSFQLDGLKDDAFWEFFKVQAFGSENLDKNQELENIGKSLIPKLKGSPLAAKTIGRLLRMDLNPKHWNNILNSELWKLEQEKTDILPALRLSYMYLPAHLKRCFSFCAVYPKDYVFNKHILAEIWVAQGFVQHQLTTVGCQYFEELVSRSFFQKDARPAETYVIHDLMHDMAQLVSTDECFIIRDASVIQRIPPIVRHLSILTRGIDCQDLVRLSKYKKLRTLLCNAAFHQDDFATAIHSWFSELQHIRMLSSVLPGRICNIPDNIGNLKLLRFLCFQSQWQKIIKSQPVLQPDFIPTIKRMRIGSCEELVSLSAERFGDLCHLEELEICQCPNINWQKLVTLPSSLRKLTLIQFGESFDHFVTCLLGLNYLILITLWDSSLVSIPLQLWTNNLPSMEKLDFINCENLTSFRGSKEVFNPQLGGGNNSNAQTFKSLTEITIENCKRLSSLEDLFMTDYVPAIRKVHVKNCLGLLSLATGKFGGFSFLEDLEIRNCPNLIWQRGFALPHSLARLSLARCGDVSEWFPSCLVNLTFLTYLQLSELSSVTYIPGDIWRNNLPALEHLVIWRYEHLKSIGGPEEIAHIRWESKLIAKFWITRDGTRYKPKR
ncbi:hypothetical protein C2845_PM05G17470 [Panicum miliaceum]|uniref:Uncharacterized protein n=1 Tax=Panicum miliaceum TaxID=4540 RepID=A0A3L6SVR8_PANMI|nr:hypothetical protein C2845_PM05G17470 [Panicum miliaceum]